MTLITSRQNPYIKHLKRLQDDAAYRNEQNTLVIEGKTLCEEALARGEVKTCLLKEGACLAQASNVLYVHESVFQKLSTLQNGEGYLAEIEKPKNASLKGVKRLLVLEGLQNPGNMGTLLRSAIAFGFDAAFIVAPSVDPYHPKVVRASMGACLQLPLRVGTLKELLALFHEEKRPFFVADAKGQSHRAFKVQEPFALILGKESQGSSLKNHPHAHLLALPIEKIDSLNVAVAGSLLMYQLREAL